MNRIVITIVTVILLSAIGFLLMHYILGWTMKKSLIIAGGAAGAMILFDVIILNLVKRR